MEWKKAHEIYKGFLIVLEGGDGSGKSSILSNLKRNTEELVKQHEINVIVTHEPGGTKISEEIRKILLNDYKENFDCFAELFLYIASRRLHTINKIIPELKKGNIVLSSRYLDSTWAYQGFARKINEICKERYGIENIVDKLNYIATDKLVPDLTIYIDVYPEEALKRIDKKDRIEKESIDFHKLVREGFLTLAKKYSDRIKVVDGNSKLENVTMHCWNLIEEYLKKHLKGDKYV